jgi:hypothetical protein
MTPHRRGPAGVAGLKVAELRNREVRFRVHNVTFYRISEMPTVVSSFGPCWICGSDQQIVAFDCTRPIGDMVYRNVCRGCVGGVLAVQVLAGTPR